MPAERTGSPAPGPYPFERRLGAWPIDAQRTEFRVWAPRAESGVGLLLGDRRLEMTSAGFGIYELTTEAPPGTDYRFAFGGGQWPDPASRFQPEGLRGPSRVVPTRGVDAGAAGWGLGHPAEGFRAAPISEQVIYELHIGTFSAAGTFAGAIEHLPGLVELGVTAVEVMPIAEFPGTRGWGYDGVYISAAQSSYGGPHGFAEFVAAAHTAGLAVILDCVYNHVGPGSDALEAFGPYFTDRYSTPWGSAVNYDDAESSAVREWACQSAEAWIREYAVDGLRLDAVHAIFDSGPEHLVAELTRRVKAIRPDVLVIAESELNDAKVMRRREVGGWGTDAAWADDFHHSLRTLLSDEREGYYADFGRVADLARVLTHRYVYDGLWSGVRHRVVGAPAGDVDRSAFVVCNQNHDQVGNRAVGDRMPGPARPLAAMLTLLSGFTPMLFMGEEYSETAPFQYFVDHIDPEIAEATRQGRQAEFAAFTSFGTEVPDPMAVETFEASKLTRREDPAVARLYRDLLALRRRLAPGDPGPFLLDEQAGWLMFSRGKIDIWANFSAEPRSLPADGTIVLTTSDEVRLQAGRLELPPLGGAVLERGVEA